MNYKYIAVDEEGYFLSQANARVSDNEYGYDLLSTFKIEDHLVIAEFNGEKIIVEAFDAPYVAKHVEKSDNTWTAMLPYGFEINFDPKTLTLDEWDRFQARASNGISLVFSRSAQMELFDLFDSYSDESVTINGEELVLPAFLKSGEHVREKNFWSEHYAKWQMTDETPGWDLAGPVPTLGTILAQLKIPKSRVAVLGCGAGHDANYFYEQGHIVTAIDYSPEAIKKARELYPEKDRLKYLEVDLLKPTENLFGAFDIVFEHTFFCAIDPALRYKAVDTYSKLMTDRGHLLGIFMIVDKPMGPPFGSTEWELRSRLHKKFEALYWTRWKHSIPKRLGRELVVYAQKRHK
jgi:SAM-dependent methyltransferase